MTHHISQRAKILTITMIKKVIHVAEDLDMAYTIFTAVEPSGTATVLRILMNPNNAPVKTPIR